MFSSLTSRPYSPSSHSSFALLRPHLSHSLLSTPRTIHYLTSLVCRHLLPISLALLTVLFPSLAKFFSDFVSLKATERGWRGNALRCPPSRSLQIHLLVLPSACSASTAFTTSNTREEVREVLARRSEGVSPGTDGLFGAEGGGRRGLVE